MKLHPSAFVAVFFWAVAAQAQTGGLPPEQAPAGSPQKFTRPSKPAVASDATPPATATTTATPSTKAQRRAARKQKRDEKVGDKPID